MVALKNQINQRNTIGLSNGPDEKPRTPLSPTASATATTVYAVEQQQTETEPQQQGQRPPTRVMIVDDHRIVRDGLVGLLQDEPDLSVVAEADSGCEALRQAAESEPDIVIMDVTMPGMNGVETTHELHKLFPHIRVIGLSMHDEEDMAQAMLRAGALAYLSKVSAAEELIEVIRHLA